MSTLYIANIRSDYAESVRAATGLAEHSLPGGDTAARFLWHLESGDVLVTPDNPKAGFQEYMERYTGVSPDALHVVCTGGLIDDATLLSELVVAQVRNIVVNPMEWTLEAFVLTPGVVGLAAILGMSPPAGHEFASEGGVALINLKSSFRALAAGIGVPIPMGVTVRSADDLLSSILQLREHSDALIVKHQRGGGGRGNIGLSRSATGLSGTRATVRMPDDPAELATALWNDLTEDGNTQVTVECYVEGGRPFYVEWYVDEARAKLVSTGEIRYSESVASEEASPVWLGLGLPGSFSAYASNRIVMESFRFIEHLRTIGYRGYANIDGLITDSGVLYFHEINARWGGGLVVAAIAEKFLGPTWSDAWCASMILDVPRLQLGVVIDLLDQAGLAYSRGGEGVLILGVDSDLGAGCELMIIARNREGVARLEAKLREVFLH